NNQKKSPTGRGLVSVRLEVPAGTFGRIKFPSRVGTVAATKAALTFKLTRTTTSGQFRQLLSLRLPIFRGVAGDKLSELIRQPVILDDELPLQVTGLLLVLAQPFVERLENLLKFRISLRILELLLH